MGLRSKRKANVVVAASFLLMVIGGTLLLAPLFADALFRLEASKQLQQVDLAQQFVLAGGSDGEADGSPSEDEWLVDQVDVQALMQERERLSAYNDQIATQGQWLGADPFGEGDGLGAFEGLWADGLAGVVSIPAMECQLPLYLGASYEHMARGAAVVEGSSAPLGGASSNCVIAGHRGWNQTAMFRDIERLTAGDVVELRTVWGNLRYRVVGFQVISPNDMQAVRVREGLDMVTLVTCHPYGYNYQRYVVFCVRDGSAASPDDVDENADIFCGKDVSGNEEGRMLDSVLGNPAFEDALRIMGVAALIGCFCVAAKRAREMR